jgi:hypothetical protein
MSGSAHLPRVRAAVSLAGPHVPCVSLIDGVHTAAAALHGDRCELSVPRPGRLEQPANGDKAAGRIGADPARSRALVPRSSDGLHLRRPASPDRPHAKALEPSWRWAAHPREDQFQPPVRPEGALTTCH